MTATPNIGLTELANGQNNYLNANESFAVVDAILQTRAISKTLTSAPGSPANGDVYIMQSAWSGITTLAGAACAAGDIAFYRTAIGAFKAIRPKEGWRIEVAADDTVYRFDGSAWQVASGGVSLPVVQSFTGNKTLVLSDINTYNVSQDATAQTVTLPAQATVAWTADAEIHIQQGAAGAVTITGATGVTINGVSAGSYTLAGVYAAATLKRTSSNTWTLIGALIEAPSALRIILKLTANQSIPAATTTIISWDAVDVSDPEVAAAWVSGGNILKVAGYTKMRVTANISYLNNTTGNRFGTVWKDGSGGAFAGQLNARCNAVNLTQRSEINGASAILDAAGFTTLQVATYQSSGAALDLYASATWASVEFWK